MTVTCHKARRECGLSRTGAVARQDMQRVFDDSTAALAYITGEDHEHGDHAHSLYRDGRPLR